MSAEALESVSGITCVGVFGCGDNNEQEEEEEIIWLVCERLARKGGGRNKGEARGRTINPLPLLLLLLLIFLFLLLDSRTRLTRIIIIIIIHIILRSLTRPSGSFINPIHILQPHIQRIPSPILIIRILDQHFRKLVWQLDLRLWVGSFDFQDEREEGDEGESKVDEVGCENVSAEEVSRYVSVGFDSFRLDFSSVGIKELSIRFQHRKLFRCSKLFQCPFDVFQVFFSLRYGGRVARHFFPSSMVDECEPLTDIFECFDRRLAHIGGRFIEDRDKGVERSGRVVVFFQAFPVFLGAYSRMRHGVFLHVSLIQILLVHDNLSPKTVTA